MEKYFGFDLGDAECAISVKGENQMGEPQVVPVNGIKNFISAYAVMRDGQMLIGENACYVQNAKDASIRFKSRFLTDETAGEDILKFAKGVLRTLYDSGIVHFKEDNYFYIGCPAGWDAPTRERYRLIFQKAGYPPVKIITESRAALMYACQSKHLQLSYDVLTKPMLVIDIGSSTTDFAYVLCGKEVNLKTGGEVMLGGGIMDEILLEHCIKNSPKSEKLTDVFEESKAWRTYCEFAARRLKEKYFSDEDYYKSRGLTQSVVVRYRLPIKFSLFIDEQAADDMLNMGVKKLSDKSFMEVFTESITHIRDNITEQLPQIVFLTGGVSKMKIVQDKVKEIFPECVLVAGVEPEFSVSKGLCWAADVDAQIKLFRADVDELIASDVIETVVSQNIGDLFKIVVDTLVEPILKNAAEPVFLQWRDKQIKRLCDIDEEMTKVITQYVMSDEAKKLLSEPIAKWLKPVAAQLEEKTIPICVKHNIPYTALSLATYMNLTDVDVKLEAKNIFAIEEITWMINAIISLIVGLLCGGSGIAIIAGGFPGIVAGAAISLLLLFIGKNKFQEAVMSADLPDLVRKAVPAGFINARAEQIESKVKQSLYDSLENDKNESITGEMTNEISREIESCLAKMAEIVEIPIA